MKDYLKWAILAGVFAIPFLSFVVLEGTFFPYIVGKNFGFRVIVEIIFGAWIVLAYLDTEYRPKVSYLTLSIVLLAVVMGIAAVFGENPAHSFWSNYERMDGYITTLHLLAYFLVVGTVLRTQKQWDYLFQMMIFVSVIVSFQGMNEVLGAEGGYQGRLALSFGNTIYLAVYMLFHIFLTLYYIFRDDVKKWSVKHYLLFVVLALQGFTLWFTVTRGTILGLAAGLFVTGVLVALFERNNRILRKMAIGIVGGIIVSVGLLVANRDSAFVQSVPILARFANTSFHDDKGNVEDRLIVWGMAYEGFKEKPILGWGQENFPLVFNKYYDARMFDAEPWFDRAHSVFFDWLITGGIFGLLSYLSIFCAALYLIWKKKESGDDYSLLSKAIFTGFLAGYFVHNIFVFDNIVSYILFFTFLGYVHAEKSSVAHGATIDRLKMNIENYYAGWRNNENNAHFVLGVVAVATVFVVYGLNYGAYMQNRTLISALRIPQAEQSLSLYKKALAYDSFGNGETRERLILQTQQIYPNQNIPSNVREDFMNLAMGEAKKQMDENIGDSKYPLFTSSLYMVRGDYQSAIEILKQAQAYAPKKDLVLSTLGDAYVQAGDYESALNVYKQMYMNAPKNTQALMRYARAAILMKNEELAYEILAPLYGTNRIPDPLILGAYAILNRYDIVRDIYMTAIKNEPTKPEYRFQLAGTYLQLGQKDNMLKTLQQALVDFPDNVSVQDSAKSYIDQIKQGTL